MTLDSKTAIFLGAGASAAEGAPMQSALFKKYFQSKKNNGGWNTVRQELATFFKAMFSIDVNKGALNNIEFPTFEEALGLLDLAELRRESFRNFDLEGGGQNQNRIRRTRGYLILAMAKVIADNLNKVEGLHFKLVANLAQQDLLRETIFISTNYDIVIDNSLELHYKSQVGMLDYGVDFVNFDKPGEQATRLYKIHGSFNWLYCPTCNNLTLTRYKKGVLELIRIMEDSRRPGGPSHKYLDDTFKWMNHGLVEDVGRARCDVCRSLRVPVIVPPTFFKDMSKVFLSLIWNKAENALRQVDRIIFCGYSFPDADLHIKYLLKRVQTNRDKKIDFIIINNPSKDSGIKKTTKQKEEEEARYNRFLGGKVDYTNNSFTDFVSHPESFYLKSRVARSSRASSKRRAASGRVKSSRPVK